MSDSHGINYVAVEKLLNDMINEHQPDVLIHSGDFMRHSMKPQDFEFFLNWFAKFNVQHKVFIPGNHDKFLERYVNDNYAKGFLQDELKKQGMNFLLNDELVINGIKFYGSPYTPNFPLGSEQWGFQLKRKKGLSSESSINATMIWNQIPNDVDVLITHGPAAGILDNFQPKLNMTPEQKRKLREAHENKGCPFLLRRIKELTNLKLHLFGHIHEGYGKDDSDGYIALNSSVLNGDYKLVNQPQIIEI